MIKWLIDEVLYFDTCSDLHTAPGICECIGAHPVKNENPKMSLKVSAIRGRSMAFATVSEIILVGSRKETCKLFQCERHLRSSNRESQGMSPTHNRQRLIELWIHSSAILTISSWRWMGLGINHVILIKYIDYAHHWKDCLFIICDSTTITFVECSLRCPLVVCVPSWGSLSKLILIFYSWILHETWIYAYDLLSSPFSLFSFGFEFECVWCVSSINKSACFSVYLPPALTSHR